MKTPYTIKNGLAYCSGNNDKCNGCPYNTDNEDYENKCLDELIVDALAYIQQLENDLQYTTDAANIMKDEALKLESRLAQVEMERDAAIHDMVQIVHEVDDNACVWCKNAYFDELKCKECRFHNEGFEWQGVQPTNTKEE